MNLLIFWKLNSKKMVVLLILQSLQDYLNRDRMDYPCSTNESTSCTKLQVANATFFC